MGRIVKDPEIRYNELVDTAESLFIDRGYDNTTVDDVVRTAGVAKGTFYYYFKSKEDVLDAILACYLEEVKEIIEKINFNEGVTAVDKLLEFSSHLRARFGDRRKLIEYVHEERNALLHLKLENKGYSIIIPFFTSVIEQGIQEGSFDTKYPKHTVLIMNALANMRDMNREAYTYFLERILGAKPGTFLSSLSKRKGE